jgi:UPF0042 nucleotide-binding protein
MSLLIVSGLSGSGKSIALQALEDMGYYCIDNLPAALLPHVSVQLKQAHSDNAAVGIDARNQVFLDALPDSLAQLQSQGLEYRIIFLEAEESVLVRRFKETRRKHPMSDRSTPLLEAMRMEKRMLEPLSRDATVRFDTTHTTSHDLRHLVHGFARSTETPGMTLVFESFGFKKGTPLDADYVFDVRCLPNPHWHEELRHFTGLDAPVIDFLEREVKVRSMFEQLCRFLENWLPSFEAEHRSYLTIAIGCTGGQHRSVYLVKKLADYFSDKGIKALVRHRELS